MTGTRRQLTTDYPHLDPAWGEDLLIALRVREVSGARIGQILAEADAHCAQTHESAPEAFGPATQYAARLDFPGQDRAPVEVTRSTIGMLAAQLVGAALTTLAGTALIGRTQVHVRAADLLVAGLVLLASWLAYRRMEQLLCHPVLASVAMGLTCVGFLLAFVWGGPRLAELPALPAFLGGLVLLCGPAVLATPRAWCGPSDVVVAPTRTATPAQARAGRLIGIGSLWLLPVAILGMLAASWLLARG